MNIVCVVLAGGEGRRMGGDKPLRRFGDGTLIDRAIELARGYAPGVAVAVREAAQAGTIDPPLIFDDPAIEGPLGGVAAALTHASAHGAEAVLTIPCDTPWLPPDLAARLGAALAATPDAGAAVAASGGRTHPVCALWRAAVLDRLAGHAAGGDCSVRRFAQACGAVSVDWPASEADPFANANTEAELEALQPRGRPG